MASSSSKLHSARRAKNSNSLAAFGESAASFDPSSPYLTVKEGSGPTVFTVGYERRSGDELISMLIDAGVDTLVDVRQRAMSRKADFRGKALASACQDAGIRYQPMPELGSTDELRDELRATGDFKIFAKKFKTFAKRRMKNPLSELAEAAKENSIAMICYERLHSECHRSVLADLLHDGEDAKIVAIQ